MDKVMPVTLVAALETNREEAISMRAEMFSKAACEWWPFWLIAFGFHFNSLTLLMWARVFLQHGQQPFLTLCV